MVDAKNN